MENALEKMPTEAEDKKEKNGNYRETTLREQKNIASITGEYMDFFNESDLLMKLEDTEFGFNIDRAREILDKKLAPLPERIDDLIKKKNIHLKEGNSLIDILANSVHTYKILAEKRMNLGKLEDISAITEADKSILNNLKKNLEAVLYYIDFLCCNEEKLKMELVKKHGYLENFEEYFYGKRSYFYDKEGDVKGSEPTLEKAYPAGVSKVAYFRFFNEWEQGNIKQENLEEELRKLDDKFINKEKIREDFKEGRKPQTV